MDPSRVPDTVTEALDVLAADGYTVPFDLRPGEVHCAACGGSHTGPEAVVERVYRFEGMSDPADESIVFGLRCPRCGERGNLVSAFGPGADPDQLDLLVELDGRWSR